MTKEEFKARWESNEDHGGITYQEIGRCAKSWGLFRSPFTSQIDRVCYQVLLSAEVKDAEDFKPE